MSVRSKGAIALAQMTKMQCGLKWDKMALFFYVYN